MKFIALLLFPVISFSQAKLIKTSLLNDKVEIMVPENLQKMTDEMWAAKYHSNNKPMFVLSDANGEVNFIADYTSQTLDERQLAMYKDFRIANLKKIHPEMNITDSAISTVNGKKVGFFKFITQASDQKVFNYYFFTLVDHRILLFTFNCTESLRSKWEKTADDIKASLTIK